MINFLFGLVFILLTAIHASFASLGSDGNALSAASLCGGNHTQVAHIQRILGTAPAPKTIFDGFRFIEAVHGNNYGVMKQILGRSKKSVIVNNNHKSALEISCKTKDHLLFGFLVSEFYQEYMEDYDFVKKMLDRIVYGDLGDHMGVLLHARLYDGANLTNAYLAAVGENKPRVLEAMLLYPYFKLSDANRQISIGVAKKKGYGEVERLLSEGPTQPDPDCVIF